MVEVAVGDQPEHHGVRRVDVAAERPGQPDLVDGSHAEVVHQQSAACLQRSLGQLDRSYVGLGDLDDRVVPQPVGEGAVVRHHPARGRVPDRAIGTDHTGEEQLGDRLDDPGSADARDPRAPDCSRERRVVRPELRADHSYPWLQRLAVDPDPLDRAGSSPLATGDLGSLEGRPGRRRGGQQPVSIAEHDLRVGADVDQQGQRVAVVRPLREHHRRRVGPHVPGDAGGCVDPRARVHPEAQRRGEHRDRLRGGQRERRRPQWSGVEPEHEVMHDRVPHQADLEHIERVDRGRGPQLDDHRSQCLAHDCGELDLTTGIHHHVGDPAHQVLAEADLGVHPAG